MFRALVTTCALAGCIASYSVPAAAQEIIHALTGTVSSIDSNAKTITVFQDNGSRGTFNYKANPSTRISFDKQIAAEATAANAFDKQGAYAVIFYYGQGDNQTAVAIKALGSGPFSSIEGTVTKYDGHAHMISVQDKSGAVQTFKLDAKSVAESNFGAIEGSKFRADKGDRVRVVSTTENGTPTVVFVRDL